MEWINSGSNNLPYDKTRASSSVCPLEISCPQAIISPARKDYAGRPQKKQARIHIISSNNNNNNANNALKSSQSPEAKKTKKDKTHRSTSPVSRAMCYDDNTHHDDDNNKNDDDNNIPDADDDDAPETWTFPLCRMKDMTPARYARLRARAADPARPQVCAAIVSGFTCIGKTTFGTHWQPAYGRHRVINLEFNQYRDLPHRDAHEHEQCPRNRNRNSNSNSSNNNNNNNNEVDSKAYLADTLIAAKFVPDAIVVVNCHTHFRRAMRDHRLAYIRVHPDFDSAVVRDAWRARAAARWRSSQPPQPPRVRIEEEEEEEGTAVVVNKGNNTSGGGGAAAGAAAKFAARMMACWEAWSEMGTPGGFDFDSSPGVVFGREDYLSTRIGDILEVGRRQAQAASCRRPVEAASSLLS